MNRYQNIEILKSDTGKRYYKNVKYPNIPVNNNDIYVIAAFNDRLDLMAYDYYGDDSLWWIIAVANEIKRDSLFVPAGQQIRIPINISQVLQDYDALNEII